MKLTTKYHLILISVLLISLVIIGSASYSILHGHAKEEVIKQADVLMEAALAMRKYTITEIKPLLALQNKRNFLPQSVPSYAATQNFEALRATHTEYRYKEATLNPTNPRDRATDWEADVIQEFRNNPEAKHMTLVRDTPSGATLYYARPIRIKNQGCLTCHGTVEDAPQTMISLYGPANGFGWKMDEVVGSQIVSLPLSLPVKRANETFFVLMSIMAGVFVILYLMTLFSFKKLFADQAMTLTTVVDRVSPEMNATPVQAATAVQAVPPRVEEILPVENSPEEIHSSVDLGSNIEATPPATEPSQQEKEGPSPERSDAVELSENSINLELDEAEELAEEEQTTISLQKMYQRHNMDELLIDESLGMDDAFTEPTSESSLESEKN